MLGGMGLGKSQYPPSRVHLRGWGYLRVFGGMGLGKSRYPPSRAHLRVLGDVGPFSRFSFQLAPELMRIQI